MIKKEDILPWWAGKRPFRAQQSWDSWELPHRQTIPLALQTTGVKSVYEIGCGAGPNLRLVQAKCPDIEIGGMDPHPGETAFASEHLGVPIETGHCPVTIDPKWEAVLSCYTLANVFPENVREQLKSIPTHWLILLEPSGLDEFFQPMEPDVAPRWHYNWSKMTSETGWALKFHWPIEPRDGLNTLEIYYR